MFATILSRTEPTKRLFDTMLVIVDDIFLDRHLEFLVAMVDAPIVNLFYKIFSLPPVELGGIMPFWRPIKADSNESARRDRYASPCGKRSESVFLCQWRTQVTSPA